MIYATTDAPVRASLELESTDTANADRYSQPNAHVRLAAVNGCPIAFRCVIRMNEGSFATQCWQAVTAKGTTALPPSEAQRLHDEATLPLN
jgi:hypothetical protein